MFNYIFYYYSKLFYLSLFARSFFAYFLSIVNNDVQQFLYSNLALKNKILLTEYKINTMIKKNVEIFKLRKKALPSAK